MAVNFLSNFNFCNAIGNKNANPNPCPDQVVGEFYGAIFTPITQRIDIDYSNGDQRATPLSDPIVIILESPHKKEYNPKTLQPIGPAMGTTGQRFINSFAAIVQNSKIYPHISSSSHKVVLVNSIQYQCSLGNKLNGINSYKNKKQRDLNWLTCFNNDDSNDLIKRISALNPCAIINLCTIGLYNLQLKVNNLVESNINQISNRPIWYTIGNHPSTWIYGRGLIQ